jgi:RNA polymerase sigma-70 factor (ECF subfamily)
VTAELAVDRTFGSVPRGWRRDEAVEAPSNRRRLEELLARHHSYLRRAAAGVLVDTQRLDDVLQEAYLKAFRNLPTSFANEAHEAAWLHRVVFHACLDELRSRRRRRDTAELDPNAAAAVDDAHVGVAVAEALRALAPADREVLLLVDLLGYDYDTAGEVLGVPRGTVASRLSAARTRFRSSFDV